ncbi:MAG TPA: hypothetical protein VJH05_01625 [Candidatus Paceibacterota bacterium]
MVFMTRSRFFTGIVISVAISFFTPFAFAAQNDGNQPIYYKNKVPVDFIFCGETYTFDVPNYSGKTVWLQQFLTKNNTRSLVFDGPFLLPMSPYKAVCGKDEGNYETIVYAIENGTIGTMKGSTYIAIESSASSKTNLKELKPGIFALKLDASHPAISNRNYFNADSAIVELLRRYQDEMDVVVVITTPSLRNFVGNSICYGCAYTIRKLVDGIGTFSMATLDPKYIQLHRYMTPKGRFNHVAIVSVYNESISQNLSNYMYVLLHEIGHAWSTFVTRGGGYSTNPLGILEENQFAHWGYVSDNHDSLMAYGPARLSENSDGSFSPIWKNVDSLVFNNFDLYFMGLLSPLQVLPTFSISNPFFGPDVRRGNIPSILRGTKKIVTVNDIIAMDGKRVPAYGISKNNVSNNVRITFLIVQGPGGAEEELNQTKELISNLAGELPSRWGQATNKLSTISVFTPPEKKPLEGFATSISDEFTDGEIKELTEDLLEIIHDDISPLKQIEDASTEQNITAPPVQPPALIQSVTEQLRIILSRLLVLQAELLDLLHRRANLLLGR